MIAKLAEPTIGTNVPRPFARLHSGIWERVWYTVRNIRKKYSYTKNRVPLHEH